MLDANLGWCNASVNGYQYKRTTGPQGPVFLSTSYFTFTFYSSILNTIVLIDMDVTYVPIEISRRGPQLVVRPNYIRVLPRTITLR